MISIIISAIICFIAGAVIFTYNPLLALVVAFGGHLASIVVLAAISYAAARWFVPGQECSRETLKILRLTDNTVTIVIDKEWSYTIDREDPGLETEYVGLTVPKFELISYRLPGKYRLWLLDIYDYPDTAILSI